MHPDWKNESMRLEEVVSFISAMLKKKLSEKEFLIHQESDINRNMWDEARSIQDLESISDFMQHIGMLKQNMAWARLTSRDIVRLDKQLSSPYFGRIDFREKGSDPDRIYIGIHSLTNEETLEILVHDWRAPISGMFYDFETGPAFYECPAGIIEGELTLKRQYRIEGGKLLYMFDSSLAIGDRILQEMLASGSGRKMRNIVSTIQKEQNAAIRNESARILSVQGAAGSGKTSVAMHRASYLLYRHKKHIKSENLVILSSTDILGDYISDVLPELGEDEIKGITFKELMRRHMPLFRHGNADSDPSAGFRIQSHPQFMEHVLGMRSGKARKEAQAAVRFKSSPGFIGFIEKFFRYAEDNLFHFQDIVYKGSVVARAGELKELFLQDFRSMPPLARLKRIENRVIDAIRPLKIRDRHEKEREIQDGDNYVSRQEARILSRIALNNDLKPVQEQMRAMFSIDSARLYRTLFEDDGAWNACMRAIDIPETGDAELARRYTLESIKKGVIGFEDGSPLLYLSILLGETAEDPHIKHVIVDEAQDYSPIQLLSLSRLFPAAGMTMLGDKNQNISPYAYRGSLKDAAELVAPGDHVHMTLNKSYRSTVEINEFAADFLGGKGEFFGRRGEKPEVFLLNDPSAMLRALRRKLGEQEGSPAKTTAIITRTLRDAKELHRQLGRQTREFGRPVRVMTEEYEYPIEGIMIVPSYLAKGLEFDAVMVVFGARTDWSDPEEGGLFYTALTRPLHSLAIFCPFPQLPPVLERIGQDKYECPTEPGA